MKSTDKFIDRHILATDCQNVSPDPTSNPHSLASCLQSYTKNL